jgi:hypothetical protein
LSEKTGDYIEGEKRRVRKEGNNGRKFEPLPKTDVSGARFSKKRSKVCFFKLNFC